MLQHLDTFESMLVRSKIESLRTAAKLYHPVEIGNYYVTILLEDDGCRRTSMCREYTAARSQRDSRQFASVDADQERGTFLNIGIATIVDVPGIEVQVPSLSDPWRSIWILTSRGEEKFVNEIRGHNSGLVNYGSLFRMKKENFDNVIFESEKLASGNRGHGSEDSDTAQWGCCSYQHREPLRRIWPLTLFPPSVLEVNSNTKAA